MNRFIYHLISFVFILAAISLFSCVTPPKKGDTVPTGKVIVIGRLDPGLDLNAFFGIKDKNELGLKLYWNSEHRKTATAATAIQTYSSTDDYFIIILPATPMLYLLGMDYIPDVSVGDQTRLEIDYNDLSVNFPEGEKLVYIGDFKIRYSKEDDAKLTISDGYDGAVKAFEGYFKDGKKGFLKPVKSLAKGALDFEVSKVTQRVYLRRE
jgi:hypothetical protein